MNADYARTVQLLLAVAPAIFSSPVFAMKGGTAINLFVQDMPRLSVDIDVVFVPHESPRDPDGHFKFLHLWPGQIPPGQDSEECLSVG